MRLSSRCGLALMAGGMLCLAQSAGAAPVYDSVTVPLTITTIAIPCTVSVPAEVPLGTVVSGLDSQYVPAYPSFAVSVNCTSPLNMEVYAQALTPLRPGSRQYILMTGGSGPAPQLYMTNGGRNMYLDGDTGQADTGYCEGTTTRTCDVQPMLWAPGNVEPGEWTAMIRFNVRYKA